MALTRAELEARLADLRAGLDNLRLQLAAQDGAIQTLEWVLAQLDADPPAAPDPEQE